MRVLTRSIRRDGIAIAAMLAALMMLTSAWANGEKMIAATATAPAEIAAPVETVAAATPAATAKADSKDRDDAATRRRAVLMLILQASGHPFGFFK
jgi:hypothetical protein